MWKHIILAAVVKAMAGGHNGPSPFSYIETHAGAGRFDLPDAGEWRSGVGAVLDRSKEFPDSAYFTALAGFDGRRRTYLGSWMLAARVLTDAGIPAEMDLCEIDDEAAGRAEISAADLSGVRARVHRCDGFGFAAGRRPDLLVIDPPYTDRMDWTRAASTVSALAGRVPFLIWYHIAWPTRPDRLVREVGADGHEVLWRDIGAKPSQVGKGCGVVLGGDAERILSVIQGDLERLALILGYAYNIRTP